MKDASAMTTNSKTRSLYAGKIHSWLIVVDQQIHAHWQPLLIGLMLVAALGGLTAMNQFVGVCGALFLLLLVVVLPRPILIVYGFAILIPLFGGFARGGLVPFLRLGQAILLLGFVLFVFAASSRQGKSRLSAIDLAFAFYFLTEAVLPVLALIYRGGHLNLSNTGVYNEETPLQTLLGPLQYYILYRIVVATISEEKQIIITLKLIFVSSIAVSIIGIMQKLGVAPVVAFLNTFYPVTNLYPEGGVVISANDLRITSTLGSFSGLAGYLCFTLIIALACYTTLKSGTIPRLLLLATVLLDSAAMFLTGTFSALIGLVIGAVVILLIARRVPKPLIFILIVVITIGFIFQSFITDRLTEWLGGGAGQTLLPTFAERIRLWRDIFLPAIGQHIVFGSGPAPAVSQLWESEESQYIALLLRGGLFYLCSYLVLLGTALAFCWRLIKGKPESVTRMVAIALLAILIAISYMNITAVYFTYVGGAQTIWMLLAIVVARGKQEQREQAGAASAAGKAGSNPKR